jgi:hypothetical protein
LGNFRFFVIFGANFDFPGFGDLRYFVFGGRVGTPKRKFAKFENLGTRNPLGFQIWRFGCFKKPKFSQKIAKILAKSFGIIIILIK